MKDNGKGDKMKKNKIRFKRVSKVMSKKIYNLKPYDKEDIAAVTFLSTLVLLLLTKLFTLDGGESHENLVVKDIERFDITHTYKQLDDNTYKIYPAYISYLSDKDGDLYMEYLRTELKHYDQYMGYTEERYSDINSVSEILQIPYSANILIEINGETEDISLSTFINKWQSIRKENLDKPEDTSAYLMEFIVKDQEITKIAIRKFDWEKQNVEVEYPFEYERDYPGSEDEVKIEE